MLRHFLILTLALMAIGCGADPDKKNRPKTVKVTGVITLQKQPLDAATIVLIPASGSHGASGTSAKDGSFELKTFPPDSGAVPGSYKVMVQKIQSPTEPSKTSDDGELVPSSDVKWLIPMRYGDIETSKLTVIIPESGLSDLKLELVE